MHETVCVIFSKAMEMNSELYLQGWIQILEDEDNKNNLFIHALALLTAEIS